AAAARARPETGREVESRWAEDGFVVRFPETEVPPDPALMLPSSEEVEALVLRQLGGTAMIAAKFCEAAGARGCPARRLGHAAPRRPAPTDGATADQDRHGGFDDSFAVRVGAPLRLRG